MLQRTLWMHGVNMQVEYPNRLTSIRATGPFVRIEGARGTKYLAPLSIAYSGRC